MLLRGRDEHEFSNLEATAKFDKRCFDELVEAKVWLMIFQREFKERTGSEGKYLFEKFF